MNQSLKLISLQLVNLVMGLFSVYFIAANVPPKIFSLVGIYEVVISLSTTFSSTGLETLALRNVLKWKQNGNEEEIKNIITQSLILRIILSVFITLPLIIMVIYFSDSKYHGSYKPILITMAFASVFSSINNTFILILRSFNKYFDAALIPFLTNSLGKLIALLIFIYFGFNFYIFSIITFPILVTIIFYFKIKPWVDVKNSLKKTKVKSNIKSSFNFTLSTYFSYIYNKLDQLVIAIFFKSEILAAFTLGKRMVQLGKTFLENLLDPPTQELVKYKGELDLFEIQLKKVYRIKNFLGYAMLVFSPLVLLKSKSLIVLLGIEDYQNIEIYLITIYISMIIYLAMKVKYSVISLVAKSKFYLLINIVYSASALVFLILFSNTNPRYVFVYLILTYGVTWTYSNFIFNKYLRLK